MTRARSILLLLVGICPLAAGGPLFAAAITVFAASSLTDGLREVAARYEQRSGGPVRLSFGSSTILARQIREGAPADLFFSADQASLAMLAREGLIVPGSATNLLSNRLAIFLPAANPRPLESARELLEPAFKRIALGDPAAVPAGVYTRRYLEAIGIWQELQPKAVATESARAVLALLEAGEVDAAILYRTDASVSRKSRLALEITDARAPAISYPAALLKASRTSGAARSFLEFLGSDEARLIFQRFGFLAPAPPAPAAP